MRRTAAVERRDQRLDDRNRSVVGANVTPGLEEVRLGDVPVTLCGGLVVVEAEVGTQRHLLQRLDELQIRGRRVDRIAAEDQEQADRARVHFADELLQRGALIGRLDFGGLACTRPSCRRCRATAFIACASAWTAGGWPSPAITRLRPFAAWRSFTRGPIQRCAVFGRRAASGTGHSQR